MKKRIAFGDWQIDYDYGIINDVESYDIDAKRLWETREYNGHMLWDWLYHICQKSWVDRKSFTDLVACFTFAQDYFQKYKPDNLPNVSMAQTIYYCHIDLEIDEQDETEKSDHRIGNEAIIRSMEQGANKRKQFPPLVIPTK